MSDRKEQYQQEQRPITNRRGEKQLPCGHVINERREKTPEQGTNSTGPKKGDDRKE